MFPCETCSESLDLELFWQHWPDEELHIVEEDWQWIIFQPGAVKDSKLALLHSVQKAFVLVLLLDTVNQYKIPVLNGINLETYILPVFFNNLELFIGSVLPEWLKLKVFTAGSQETLQ